MDLEFGFTLGVLVSFWVAVLAWPGNSKETKQAISILTVIQIVICVANELIQ